MVHYCGHTSRDHLLQPSSGSSELLPTPWTRRATALVALSKLCLCLLAALFSCCLLMLCCVCVCIYVYIDMRTDCTLCGPTLPTFFLVAAENEHPRRIVRPSKGGPSPPLGVNYWGLLIQPRSNSVAPFRRVGGRGKGCWRRV